MSGAGCPIIHEAKGGKHSSFCCLAPRAPVEAAGLQPCMLGINCDWRMTWTRHSPDSFGFVNEEQTEDGSWAYIDEWRFQRKTDKQA